MLPTSIGTGFLQWAAMFSELFVWYFVYVSLFLVSGGYICSLRGTSWRPGGSQGRFWSDLGGHFGAIGGPGVTLWGHIGALDGVFWGLFCAVYCRRVFGRKMLTELCQNGVPMHGIL